ncbi:AAA family ATPase [Nocardioides lijunqiniae]|uniref:AAA family ATPase n=1 Tax=Nocardioides lijunqiniae TaxID=2760832 RepID=UPI001878E34E|nr:AAA family ATPase [Nocardioides lijunqiniae]
MSTADDFDPVAARMARAKAGDARWQKAQEALGETSGEEPIDGSERWTINDVARFVANPPPLAADLFKRAVVREVETVDAVRREVGYLRVRHEAKQQFEQELRGASAESNVRMIEGGSFIHDLPPELPCIWGTGSQVVWASGEALTLVGTPGVGKTTLAGQVVRARLVGGEVLGMEVTKTESRVLYLAMDRPKQIARALARQLRDVARSVLDDGLTVWPGPPVQDLAAHPELMLQMARDSGADTVVVDSLKDAALGLSNDEVGAGYNRARQLCLANGVEVFELHHMKKQGGSGSGKATKPTKLEDVYGSAWLTAGAGSVVILVGEAGDPVVEWRHLKQPAEPVGPLTIEHDHHAGTSAIYDGTDPYEFIRKAGDVGITVRDFCDKWLGPMDPSKQEGRNAIAKARRKLDAYVRSGFADCIDRGDKAERRPARYAARVAPLDAAHAFSPISETESEDLR